ncbi:MAG: hypothetical protein HC853_03060 [Anaerolineae bacterium]|nr:hypothetical protein [Anaerolineae bacterium]
MRTICITAAPDLAAEMTRFFDGKLETCLGEVFQNAHRANATRLTVTYELESRKLIVEDDGIGIADPAILLNAGRTAWDLEKIIEPAGCGFFALLDERLFESVTVSSMDWQFLVTPEDRARLREIHCIDAPMRSSTCIELRLVRQWTLDEVKRAVESARAYYPLALSLNGMNLPARTLAGVIHITLPNIGHVYWSPENGWKHPENIETIWACKSLGYHNVDLALEAAAKAAEHPEIARVLLTGKLRWLVNPACGVRPVLPQRDRTADSEALYRAAIAIMTALIAQVVRVGTHSLKTWPDQLAEGFVPERPG